MGGREKGIIMIGTLQQRRDKDQARQLIDRHSHAFREDTPDAVRASCDACLLNGFGTGGSGPDATGPNWAGWARVWVQAQYRIPGQWREAFEAERASNNEQYAAALKRDIDAYGVEFAPLDTGQLAPGDKGFDPAAHGMRFIGNRWVFGG
jgi:hypothetical protein